MGLDASVRCNCWEKGVEIPEALKPYIYLHKRNDVLCLNVSEEQHESLRDSFWEWLEHACPHPEMEYTSQHIANWAGIRSLREALIQLGESRFPMLLHQLPDNNEGCTTSGAARIMLKEIEEFEEVKDFGTRYVLIDSDSGEECAESIDAYDGVFALSPNFNLAMTPKGFAVRRPASGSLQDKLSHPARLLRLILKNPKIQGAVPLLKQLLPSKEDIFQSKRFEQVLHDDPNTTPGSCPVSFIDIKSGKSILCDLPIPGDTIPWPDGRWENDEGRICMHYPTSMHVVKRPRNAKHYSAILQSLKALCSASLVTGNPIRWH